MIRLCFQNNLQAMGKGVLTERQLIVELLDLYKSLPCLWDPIHSQYNNKESREAAYELLREKYRELYEDASIDVVKKKIEHMRATYRREYRKVVASLVAGGKKHVPSLWYYDHLTFLNNVNKFPLRPLVTSTLQSDAMDDEDRTSSEDEEPSKKKTKLTSIYLEDFTDDVQTDTASIHSDQRARRESEAFGRTVGLQLGELRQVQRYLAEKLISDVIYLARMEHLTGETTVGTEN